MAKKTTTPAPIDEESSDEISEIPERDYEEIFNETKRELLLDGHRYRVITMSFHAWFSKTYKRDFKPISDKNISLAYHAGAADEIENNAYLAEHTELKMNHYKTKASNLADQVQILYSLLSTVASKSELSETLRKLIRKVLSEQP